MDLFFIWRTGRRPGKRHGSGDRPSCDGGVARVMRVRSSEDTPESVMEVPRFANYACPQPPADVCFVGQYERGRAETHCQRV